MFLVSIYQKVSCTIIFIYEFNNRCTLNVNFDVIAQVLMLFFMFCWKYLFLVAY